MAKVPAKKAAPAPSAAPGTVDSKAKKPKKSRVAFLKDDHKIEELKELESHDSKIHLPIKRTDFKDEALFFEYKAVEMDKRAAGLREKAVECRALGSVTDRAKAKKLIAMQKRMAELKDSLKKQGIDVEALLAATTEDDETEKK